MVQINPQNKSTQTRNIAGIAAGMSVIPAIPYVTRNFKKQVLKHIRSDSFMNIHPDKVKNVADTMMKKFGLEEKGLRVFAYAENSEYGKFINNNYGGGVFIHSSSKNIIEVVDNKLSLLIHEMGHAINSNCSNIGKYVKHKIFPHITVVKKWGIPSLIGLGVLYNKSSENKPLNFVQDHIGAIAAIPFIPHIIEEGSASLKGLKYTKLAEPTILKPLKFNLGLGFMTYLAEAAFAAGGAKLAVAVKNKIAGKPLSAQVKQA